MEFLVGDKGRMPGGRSRVVILATLVVVFVYRFYLLWRYSFRYLDGDSAVLWYATACYAHGNFPEPFFFGQNYNMMIEALFAVPLYWLHVPLWAALPVASFFVAAAPFIILSVITFRRNPLAGEIILLFPCFMGLEYDVLTCLPHPFFGGYFFAVVGGILFVECKNRWLHGLGMFLMVLGYIANATSVFVSTLFVLFCISDYFPQTGNERKFELPKLLCALTGLLAGIALNFCFLYFYKLHPMANVNPLGGISFNVDVFCKNFAGLKNLLAGFVFDDRLWFLFVIAYLAVAVHGALKCGWKSVLVSSVFLIMLGIFMAVPKTLDFEDRSLSFLFSQARMYLFLPLVLVVLLYLFSLVKVEDCKLNLRFTSAVFLLEFVACVCCLFKVSQFNEIMQVEANKLTVSTLLPTSTVRNVLKAAEFFRSESLRRNMNLIVVQPRCETIVYTSAAIMYGDVDIYESRFDRREWIRKELEKVLNDDTDVLLVFPEDGRSTRKLTSAIVTVPAGDSIAHYVYYLWADTPPYQYLKQL